MFGELHLISKCDGKLREKMETYEKLAMARHSSIKFRIIFLLSFMIVGTISREKFFPREYKFAQQIGYTRYEKDPLSLPYSQIIFPQLFIIGGMISREKCFQSE